MSGLALSVVVPCKGRSVYAQAELRRFGLENWKDFRYLASGSRTISEATGPDCDLARLEDFLTEVHQQDGDKMKQATGACWKHAGHFVCSDPHFDC